MNRRETRQVQAGNAVIGGSAPVTVQSMTCTDTADVQSTVKQIHALEEAGCEIVRVAVPDMDAADAVASIKKSISIPLVADIHFDYKLALRVLDLGVDKVRINPGNIGSSQRVNSVLASAGDKGVPVRIGVNSGSLSKEMLNRFGGVTAGALVESALQHVNICEKAGFEDLVISIKASDVSLMITANRLLSEQVNYPIHLGVTEAGTRKAGSIRSAIGIGTLLAEGIGDTLRVSLTSDPVYEVQAGFDILKSLRLRVHGPTIISCPTCGRLQTDLIPIAEAVEERLKDVEKNLTVAIMGCAVNGPGEAREADIGVACGKHEALLFKKGQIIGKIKESEMIDRIVAEVLEWED